MGRSDVFLDKDLILSCFKKKLFCFHFENDIVNILMDCCENVKAFMCMSVHLFFLCLDVSSNKAVFSEHNSV